MILLPIIKSLLENDLYKFNMGNVIFKRFNNYNTVWTFKCRNENVKFTDSMAQEIRDQLDHYCGLRFTDEEISYLRTACPWLSEGYLNYLKFWHPVRSEIIVQNRVEAVDATKLPKGVSEPLPAYMVDGNASFIRPYNDCGLEIEARGTWLNTSMYEIAILAIVSEVYFSLAYPEEDLVRRFKSRTDDKLRLLRAGKYYLSAFSEFGMRRRLSALSQDWLVGELKGIPGFVGTSNVELARKHGVKPVGTMAHEFVQCVGQADHSHNPAYSNRFMMKAWTDEYQTRNGIALADTVGTDVFLRDFDLTYATLFSGVRQDSGDPIEWGEKLLEHYRRLGIDAHTKTLLFSDSLDFERAAAIYRHFSGRCKVAFGIGTYLANDTGLPPLNIVMKVTECNGGPVAKLSDSPGKGMCRDDAYVDYLNRTIKWRLDHED